MKNNVNERDFPQKFSASKFVFGTIRHRSRTNRRFSRTGFPRPRKPPKSRKAPHSHTAECSEHRVYDRRHSKYDIMDSGPSEDGESSLRTTKQPTGITYRRTRFIRPRDSPDKRPFQTRETRGGLLTSVHEKLHFSDMTNRAEIFHGNASSRNAISRCFFFADGW